jgi:hypothetical protein
MLIPSWLLMLAFVVGVGMLADLIDTPKTDYGFASSLVGLVLVATGAALVIGALLP